MTTIAQQLKNKENVLMKFSDAPFDGSGVLSPGWAEPTYDDFFMRLVDKPVLVEQSTVFPMTALEHDLDDLEIKVELDAQRTISSGTIGASTGLTSNETVPTLSRKKLRAARFFSLFEEFSTPNISSERVMAEMQRESLGADMMRSLMLMELPFR